jgi:hypothetical protein
MKKKSKKQKKKQKKILKAIAGSCLMEPKWFLVLLCVK